MRGAELSAHRTCPVCLTWHPPAKARDYYCPSCHAHQGRCCRTKNKGVKGDCEARKVLAAKAPLITHCQSSRCRSNKEPK